MRIARTAAGLPADGEPLVPMRSPLGFADPEDDLSFQHWTPDDPLPTYVNHVTDTPLVDVPLPPRLASVPPPSDWPRHFPHHEAFGPRSTVAVPVPPPYPSLSDGVSHGMAESAMISALDVPAPASDVDMTVSTMDRDMSRGMGQLLRHPNRLRPPASRARAPNLGPSVLAPPDLFVSASEVLATPEDLTVSAAEGSPHPRPPTFRTLRPKRAPAPSSATNDPVPKRPG
jgi:hypothetical protein